MSAIQPHRELPLHEPERSYEIGRRNLDVRRIVIWLKAKQGDWPEVMQLSLEQERYADDVAPMFCWGNLWGDDPADAGFRERLRRCLNT